MIAVRIWSHSIRAAVASMRGIPLAVDTPSEAADSRNIPSTFSENEIDKPLQDGRIARANHAPSSDQPRF